MSRTNAGLDVRSSGERAGVTKSRRLLQKEWYQGASTEAGSSRRSRWSAAGMTVQWSSAARSFSRARSLQLCTAPRKAERLNAILAIPDSHAGQCSECLSPIGFIGAPWAAFAGIDRFEPRGDYRDRK